MSFLSEIERIKEETFGVAIIATILLIVPGLTFIFYFSRELFIALDIIKLVLLSISLIAPFLFVNFIIFATISESNKSGLRGSKENVFMALTVSLIFSAAILYITLLMAYFFEFSFRTSLGWASGLQLILVLLFVFGTVKNLQKKI